VSAPDDDLPFILNVESAFWIADRGTVIMGVIEQGVLHIGDHLEVIQPGNAGTAQPPRFRCLGVDPAPRVTGRDPTLGIRLPSLSELTSSRARSEPGPGCEPPGH
jgi:hypothetical protein